MNVQYLFEGVDVSARTRMYIEKKLEVVERVFVDAQIRELIIADVEIEKDKRGEYRVEIMLKTPKNTFRSENISDTIENAMDLGQEDLKRQIREVKEREAVLKKRGARSIKKKMVIDKDARF
ncbi:MAG: ribosome-associated translation inhibitor RaiA [Candidatus Moraniibacteriota bacterium]|nr:MAG: ribosome-associated translation inhibitor RaiA [Candidatus Moranbacteria bacterium]